MSRPFKLAFVTVLRRSTGLGLVDAVKVYESAMKYSTHNGDFLKSELEEMDIIRQSLIVQHKDE